MFLLKVIALFALGYFGGSLLFRIIEVILDWFNPD
jgi:hypothetical protein